MPEIGQTIAHYKILEKIGVGGMGEVYLAEDLSLDRKVALKFLPDVFTGDPERMARFEREAKLLASLNHPNIAAIYGLEQADGKRFLIMEYVEGETLQARISTGALPVEEALGVCRQIAEGLEAAHENGVIHRDLKPANVMITAEETVKILDFGLAKALSDDTQSIDSSQSPTITEAMTRPGVILGTAAYMSPEQAKGKPVDKRADIWAFGCILYECLTGNRAFMGETVTETLAEVLTREPDWGKITVKVRPLLRRCLEKDTKKRVRDVAEAMEWVATLPESSLARHAWIAWGIAAVLFIIVIATVPILYIHFSEKAPVNTESTLFEIAPPVSPAWGGSFAVSPDGRHLAFAGAGSDGLDHLYIRERDSLETRQLAGTESPNIPPFFWSPDSRFIAFDSGDKLKKINIRGGPAESICDLSADAIGGSWSRDGVIIFGTNMEGLMSVSAAGGSPSPLTRQDSHNIHPAFLPDGRNFLWLRDGFIYVGSLDSKPEEQGSKKLMATGHGAIFIPSRDARPGHILFLREQTLMAQQYDDKRLELVGEPIQVAEQVGSFAGTGYFSASSNGVLVYRSGGYEPYGRATWLDRQGKVLGAALDGGIPRGVALSPDGLRAVLNAFGSEDLWLLDLVKNTSTRFTFGQGYSVQPVWSPDGKNIIFASDRDGPNNLYQKAASGVKGEELLLESSDDKFPTSWSSDGRLLLYSAMDPKTKADLLMLPLENGSEPIPFLQTESNESDGHFSPDMRWIAYTSDESGYNEIYVRGFSNKSGASFITSGPWQISAGGGAGARWGKDGKELYYRAPDGKVMVVEIDDGAVFGSGTPKSLFQAPSNLETFLTIPLPNWDVSKDGNRFLLMAPAAEGNPAPFTVVLNWQAGLRK